MAFPKISLRGITKAFGPKKVLQGIELDVAPGESMVVIGGSGTGKSVLLKCILGLLKPDQGSIKVDGEETTSEGLAQRLERWGSRNKGTIAVLIGGAEGLPRALSARADVRLLALCSIMGLTGWTGLARLLRGEAL